ncbi:MAG: DMT family transporter [Parvibaculaceae bacterium]
MENSRANLLFPGVPLAIGSAVLFGATPLFSKLLLREVHPLILAGLLYLGAGLGLAIYRWLRRPAGGEAPLGASDMPWLALAIGAGGTLAPVLLMIGLVTTTASTGALLLNLEGVATMVIAWLVYKENVDRRLLVGAFAILSGAVLISWTGSGVSLDMGALLIAGACIAWGLDNNVTRRISGGDPVVIAMSKGLVAGCVNLLLGFFAGAPVPGALTVLMAAVIGFFVIGVSLVAFILALRHLGTARTGAYYSLAPFLGAILSVVVLAEPLTVKLVIAGGLMAVGIWLHLTERHEHEHRHDVLEHEHSHVHDSHHRHRHDGGVTEPHSHWHRHAPLIHKHPHYPDLHHRHGH